MKKRIFIDNILINQQVHTFSLFINRLVMKTISLFTGLLLIVYIIRFEAMSSPANKNSPEIISGSASGEFKIVIQPILQNNCSSCHFPGGKMYERMPFDKCTTIITHAAGIVSRIKNKDEAGVIEKFVNESK